MKQILRLLLLLCLAVGGLRAAKDPVEVVQRLREELKTVDRVVVERFGIAASTLHTGERIILDIKDPQAIAALSETVEFKEFRPICACMENVVIHFYQGEEEKFPLTLHHYYKLRADNPYKIPGQKSPWGGDAVLTEASAEKLRTWFAAQGYDGFVKGYASAIKSGEEAEQQWDILLMLFPEAVRGLFPSESEFEDVNFARKYFPAGKSVEFPAEGPPLPLVDLEKFKSLQNKQNQWLVQYPERIKLVLDCWRGIGQLSTIGYRPGNDREEFFSYLIDVATPKEINAALDRLPDDDTRVWVGAYLYYKASSSQQGEQMAQFFSEEWLARLAKRVMPILKDEQWWLIRDLAKRPAAATNRLLLEIAESGPLTLLDDGVSRPAWWRMSNSLMALLALAKNHVVDVQPLIAHGLAQVADPDVKLVLEVARAQFDGPEIIKLAHLQSKVAEVAELAWQTLSKNSNAPISIETLALLAAKSSSYDVRNVANKKLQAFGLRVMTDQEKAAVILAEPRFKEAIS